MTYPRVYSSLTGEWTELFQEAVSIETVGGIEVSSPSNNDVLKYNTSSAAFVNDSIENLLVGKNISTSTLTTSGVANLNSASVINNSLLLYDRLFSVAKTMASTATEAVSGVPTRYQSGTAGAGDYIGGNFVFPMNPTTVLPATAHNWTVCTYTDQDSAAGTFPVIAGVSACTVGGIDLAVGNWFMPLAAGDVGVKALTQMQCSASVATGTITFVLAHPIAVNACPIANISCLDDGLYTSLNLTNIYDSACLALLELPKPATTATNYSGLLRTVSE
jgi:hypothetical protein